MFLPTPSHLFISVSMSICVFPLYPLSSSGSPCRYVFPPSTECDCSGRSEECLFDMEQYRSSGHGGRCLNCRDNTQGPHCERCTENHYRASPQDPCLPCDCNVDGSEHLQCDVGGGCVCRATVTGAKCDTCQVGFHSLGPTGCRPCGCDARGSVGHCSLEDGGCYCKPNVEGQACDRCKPGFFHLQQASPAGCQACFCFGHSLACSASTQHGAINITSHFHQDQDGWLGEFSGGQQYPLLWKEGEVYLLPLDEHDTGFYKAPDKFLGNQINSYGHFIYFTFTSETPDLLPGRVTVLLEGGGVDGRALRLSADLPPLTPPSSSSSSSLGRAPVHTFAVRLHEEEVFRPTVSSFQFRHLLHNLTAFKISNAGGHNYTSQLSGVRLASAAVPSSSSPSPLAPAPWVEVCSCPRGFAGRLCESCAPGFTRETPRGGPLAPCVPCTCHQHGPCHPETGTCDCSDFTAGTTCEQCLEGYYGNALIGTPGDCRPCPCPGRTSCAQITQTGEVVCTNCPAGRAGVRCQKCEDGSHGDPLGQAGPVRACARCDCSGNADPNAVGTCHHLTGRCLKCLGHTEGERCERCQQGFYGDALNQTMTQKCKSCSCSPAGTSGPGGQCHPQTGHCHCLPNVGGRDCSRCQVGFFHLQPGHGCQGCDCNSIGSSSTACHPITGMCMCRAGVEGRQCDSCRAGFFSFSSRGCRACNCDPMGSVSMQCHGNGTCHCRQGFMGYKCDKCQLNFYHNRATHHCEACPICYGLVKDKVETLGAQLAHLERLLARYDCRGRRLPPLQRSPADHQGEDALPNALEDILAFQEAREAFIQRFSALGASTHTLSAQLQGIATAMGCGAGGTAAEVTEEEEEEGVEVVERSRGGGVACQTLAESVVMVRASDERLKKATLDLNNMIIPFELATGPNKWNIMVNDSRALMKSHEGMADRIEGVARDALRTSNQTFVMLLDLLQDNSTHTFIRGLEERLSAMQELKRNLTATANQTLANQLALEEGSLALHIALGNITSSIRQMALTDPGSDQTTNHSAEGLLNRTAELALHVHNKEELVSTIQTEMEPVIQAAIRHLEKDFLEEIQDKKACIEGAKVIALTSVVSAKEMESEVITLHKEMETMERDWPRLQAQTRLAVKKERPLEEKVLADVRKKVKQVEKMLNPALGNTRLSNATAHEALEMATAAANEAKDNVVQAKQTRSASRHLGTQVEATIQQLAQLENSSAIASTQLTSEPMNLRVVKEDMEATKLQLELYASTLTELVSKIDGQVKLERFDRILNETALRLRMLRGSVESPALGGKIQRLRSAAQEQQGRLASIEADLQEISQERDSLKDITLNLPKSCPLPTGAG
ncbi:unnamed protein product [Arctogadus glacialis]